jgi:hypothetical protein
VIAEESRGDTDCGSQRDSYRRDSYRQDSYRQDSYRQTVSLGTAVGHDILCVLTCSTALTAAASRPLGRISR